MLLGLVLTRAPVLQMASLRTRLQQVSQERDEHFENLTQAGEFGHFLLLENETLKRQAAEMQCTLSLTARTPPRNASNGVSASQRHPFIQSPGSPLVPVYSTPGRSGLMGGSATASPSTSLSPSTPQFRLKSPSHYSGADEALLSQLSSYKRTAEDALRRNASLEREHKRLLETLQSMDEEVVITRQRLDECQAKVCACVRAC